MKKILFILIILFVSLFARTPKEQKQYIRSNYYRIEKAVKTVEADYRSYCNRPCIDHSMMKNMEGYFVAGEVQKIVHSGGEMSMDYTSHTFEHSYYFVGGKPCFIFSVEREGAAESDKEWVVERRIYIYGGQVVDALIRSADKSEISSASNVKDTDLLNSQRLEDYYLEEAEGIFTAFEEAGKEK